MGTRRHGHTAGRAATGSALAIVIAAFAALASAADGAKLPPVSPVRIVSPTGGLVTSTRLRVVVRTAPRLRTFAARLHGLDVTRFFHRSGPETWSAVLTRSRGLHPGPAVLAVLTTDSSGRQGVASVALTIGRPLASYVLVSAGGRSFAPGSIVRVLLRSKAGFFRVRLNGRDVTRVFGALGRARAGRLATNDGLHFGRNRLVVTAARRDGAYASVARTLAVPRSFPLAAAGPDQLTMSGQLVRLTAHATLRARRGDVLRYAWTLVRRPRGSRTTIRRAHSIDPTLKPDVPGRFVARVTVTEQPVRGPRHRPGLLQLARASDEATIGNQPSFKPIGAPINTLATLPNGEPAVTVGPARYPTRNVVEELVFDRQLLSLEARNFFDGPNAASNALSDLKQRDSSQLVVLATGAVSNPGVIAGDWSKVWAQLGASASGSLSNGNWSVIGVPGATSGGISNSDGGMTGYLQFDSTGDYPSYAFVLGQYADFSTSTASTASSNTMQVNGQSYASQALNCPAGGGLQVLAISSQNLTPVSNSTYATNCGNATADQQALTNLHNQLTALSGATGGPHVLLVQSIGTPYPSDAPNQWYQVGLDLGKLGGTAGVFNTATGAYALAGGDGLTEPGSIASRGSETSTSLTGNGGTLSGVLRRDGQYHYEVTLGAPGTNFTQTLTDIVYPQQPLQPWAPTSSAAQQAIVTYITAQVLGIARLPSAGEGCYVPTQPDIRAYYCDLTLRPQWVSMSEQVNRLIGTTPPTGTGFSQSDWNDVTTELSKEMKEVPSVYAYILPLAQVYGTSHPSVQVQSVFQKVAGALNPPPSAQPETGSFWTEFVADIFDIGALLPGEDVVAGILGAGTHLAADVMSYPDGTPELNGSTLGIAAGDLGVEITNRYQAMSEEVGHLADMIVSDGGKLRAFEDANLGTNTTGLNELAGDLSLSAARVAWGKLLSAAYRLDMLHEVRNNNPPWCPVSNPVAQCVPPASGFLCDQQNYQWFPFKKAPPDAQFVVPIPQAPGTADRGELFVVADPGVNGGWYPDQMPWISPVNTVRTPSKSLLSPLFQPLSAGGLGLYKQWFYARNFDTNVQLPAAAKTGATPYYFSCQM